MCSRFARSKTRIVVTTHRLIELRSAVNGEHNSLCEQQEAIKKSKELLISATVLIHFDPKKKLVLACDASLYGIGAVLSHQLEDGSDRPIAFASRSLAPAEKKYSQLEKEGLAVVFGIIKFQQYLLGRDFTILSDHNPLQYLLSADRAISPMAHSTMGTDTQRAFKAGRRQGNMDVLSRLPLKESSDDVPLPGDTVYMLEALDSSGPVTTAAIKSRTDKDPILSRV